MLFIVQVIVALLCCLTVSYFLGKYFLNKLFPKVSSLLYIPFGFVIYEVIFFFISIAFVYSHGSWNILFILASIILGLIMIFILYKSAIKDEIIKIKKISKKKLLIILFVVFLALTHGVIQIGFWNVDNAMSDNSFYITQAVSVMKNDHIFLINAADGMAQAKVVTDYFLATYEISMSFLAQVFGFHPAAFLRIVVPIWISVAILLTVYSLFRQLLKKDGLSLIAVLLYFIFFYYSPNYKNSLNDYLLEEWFLYYLYIGKGIARYLIIPLLLSILISTKERLDKGGITTKELVKQVLLYIIVSLAAMIVSPAASVYVLAILFVYFLFLLFNSNYKMKQIIFLGVGSSFGGIFGVLASFMTKLSSNQSIGTTSSEESSWLQFFGINSENFNLETIQSFFIKGLPTDDYWYPRISHIMLIVFLFVFLFGYLIYLLRIEKHYKKYDDKAKIKLIPTEKFYIKYHNIFFFGLFIPITYVVLYHLPPIVEVVSIVFDDFGFQRLIGSYPYEIFMIASILLGILYFNQVILSKFKYVNKSKILKTSSSLLLLLISIGLFIKFPSRPFTYEYAMSQERRERLKFKDDYYSGKFNYELLLTNPYKLDYQAEQIVSVLSKKDGDKVVMGTINQFFGLSHVRNYDNQIDIIKTRFSTYEDETLSDYAYTLKIYFSPWENKFKEYQENNSESDIIDALKAFDTNYIVIIKSYKESKYFGTDMLEKYEDIIVNVDETEQFYIAELDLSQV